jgi:uncharacterized protein involved in outer membrane biogenesis
MRIGLALALLLVSVFLYLNFADLSRYRSNIEDAVTAATGREFRIAGEFRPRVFPAPALVAADITLANADWAGDTPFVSIGHLSVTVDLWSLIAGPARIRTFILRDVAVLLQENEAGENNWQMMASEPQPMEPDSSDGDTVPAIIDFAEVRNITITRRRVGVGDRVAVLASLDLKTNEEDFIVALGKGQIDEHRVSLSATVGPTDHLASAGDIEYSFAAEFGVADVNISGSTGDKEKDAEPRLEALVTSDDVSALLAMLEVPADVTGALRIESMLAREDHIPLLRLKADIGDISAEGSARVEQNRIDFDATVASLRLVGDALQIADLPDAPLTIAGGVSSTHDSYDLHDVTVGIQSAQAQISGVIGKSQSVTDKLNISLSAPSLRDLRSKLPDIPLAATVTAAFSPAGITAEQLEVTFGESDISGELEIQFSEPVSVAGSLRSELLDLSDFSKKGEDTASQVAVDETDAATDTETSAAEWVFTEEPLPFRFLSAASVDLDFVVNVLQQGPATLEGLKMSLALDDGNLALQSGFDVAAGGSANTKLSLAVQDNGADLEIISEVRDLRLSLVENDTRDLSQIPPIGIEIDVRSSGGSARDLAASSNGSVIFTQGAGQVDNSASGFFSTDIVSQLFGALNPFSEKEPYSNWECTVFALDINSGVAEISSMLAQSEKVTIVGEGGIDLNTEKLNISFNTKQRQGVGISADMFVTPFVQLAGTLAKPRLGLDKKGVLLSGTAAVMTAGASFFVKGVADRASGASDRCAAALAIARGLEVEVQ